MGRGEIKVAQRSRILTKNCLAKNQIAEWRGNYFLYFKWV